MELLVADQPRTDLQGAMKSWSRWVLSWMMTRVSLDTATKASICWLVEQSSTTTAQDKAPLRDASGENLGLTDSFFLGAKRANLEPLSMVVWVA